MLIGHVVVEGQTTNLSPNGPISTAPTDGPGNVIKLNPLSLFATTLNIKYERRISQRFSGQIGFHIGQPRSKYRADSLERGIRYFFVGIAPEFRYYIAFNRIANPKGLFVASFARYTFVKEHYSSFGIEPGIPGLLVGNARLERHVVSLGFLLGYQFMFKKKVSLDVFIGPQYNSSSTKREFACSVCSANAYTVGRPGIRYDGVGLRSGIAVGYAF